MFCVHCGARMEVDHKFCAACGSPVGVPAGPTRSAAAIPPGLERHLPILGALWILRGGLRLVGAAWLYLVGAAMVPWIAGLWHGPMGGFLGGFIPGVIRFSAWIGVLVAVASIATGLGLLQREPWARPLALVMSFLALFSIPFGTALGIYTLWILLPSASESEYRRLAGAA